VLSKPLGHTINHERGVNAIFMRCLMIMMSKNTKRIIGIFICLLALGVTSWLELFTQQKQHLIGAGINRVFLFLLINTCMLVIAFLLYIIIRQSIRLFMDLRKDRPGSVFKRNLLFAFTLFSVIPSFFVFFTAGKFIATSIDDWFDARIECGLQNGLTLHQQQTQSLRAKLLIDGQKIYAQVMKNPDNISTEFQKIQQQSPELAKYTLYILGITRPNLIGKIKDEMLIWREYRKVNDRTTHRLKKEFLDILNSTENENPFDFYGSLYFVKKTEGLFFILVQRYPENIRYPLIEIQNSISDYQQLKSIRNPIFLNYIFTFILVTLLILFLSIWCAFYFARGLGQPIQEMLCVMSKIRSGDLNARIKHHPNNDLHHLTIGLNKMTDALQQANMKIETQNQEMLKINTLKTWQEAAKQMAHEIKNPLTPIQLATQRMQRKYCQFLENDPAFIDCTNTILTQVKIIQGLVWHFSRFASMPQLYMCPTQINDLIKESVALYQISYPEITFDLNLAIDLPMISIDKNKMKRVFTNLLDNSVRAIQKMGATDVKLIKIESRSLFDQKRVSIIFSDTGPGIAKDMKNRLFLPYVSTEKKNMGLGLAIVHEIISLQGGTIKLEPATLGARFIIELPIKS